MVNSVADPPDPAQIMHRFNWEVIKTIKKPKTSATKVHFIENGGLWTRNNDSGSDYDGYSNDDDSDYDSSDDSDYDVYDDSDYTDDNDNYNDYDTCDEDGNFDDGNDTLCALCDDGGKLISCTGQCKRSFHPRKKDGKESKCKTLGYTSTKLKDMGSFLCKNCEFKQHQCSKCGELEPSGKPNAKVFKCNNPTCGRFYHPKCVAKLLKPDVSNGDGSCELEKRIMEGMPFTCPIHWCFQCETMENRTQRAMQFAMCRRCPKSYHIKCLPREISFETKDQNIEQRAWHLPGIVIIYCLDHKICRATGNAKRDHIKFPQTPNIVKVHDLAKQKGKMVNKWKRSADQCSVKSIKAFDKLPRRKIEHTQNSLHHMVLKPEGSAMSSKEDLQIESSLVEATNQSSQIALKWLKKKPRSPLSFVMRTRMLSSGVGSKTKRRKTTKPKKERPSRKSYNIAKKCVEPPTQDMEKDKKAVKGFVAWNDDMDKILLDTFVKYYNKGDKCQNGWKPHVYTAAIKNIREKCRKEVTKDNIQSRCKMFDKHHSIINGMLGTSGFGWDSNKNKISVVDSDAIWEQYVEKNKEASGYRYKTVLYWDSISLFYGKDRATSEAARTASETSREMGKKENSNKEPTSSATSGSLKRQRFGDSFSSMIAEKSNQFTAALKNEAPKYEAPKGPTSKEILATLNEVGGLDEDTLLEVYDILTNDARKYESLVALPAALRKKWLLKQLNK